MKIIFICLMALLVACGTPKSERTTPVKNLERIIVNLQVEDMQEIVSGLMARNDETRAMSLKILKNLDQTNYENVIYDLNDSLLSKLEVGQSYSSFIRVTGICSFTVKKKVTVVTLAEGNILRDYKRDLEIQAAGDDDSCTLPLAENVVQFKWQSKNNTWAQFDRTVGYYLANLNKKNVILAYENRAMQFEKVTILDPRVSFYQNPVVRVERSLDSKNKSVVMTINTAEALDDLSGVDLTEVPVRDLR